MTRIIRPLAACGERGGNRMGNAMQDWAGAMLSTRSRWGRAARWCASAILAGLLPALLVSSPAAAQAVVKAKYGDWEMRCETPPGASREQCALIQSIAAEDKPNINLVVIVLKTADNKSRLLRVIAPLGVLLPAGLGLKVDRSMWAGPGSSAAFPRAASRRWSWRTSSG